MFSIDSLYQIYNEFLSYFPENARWLVSLFLAGLLVIGVYKVLRRQFIYLILLVILLPASVPILKNVWEQIVQILQFLITRR